MYIIQSSPVNPFKQQPAFLRLAAISPLCLYLQESGGYMAAESPLEAKIQISSFGKNPIWVREGGPTLRGHHTCPSSRMTTLSGGIDSPWRALQNTKVSAENDFSPQVGFFYRGTPRMLSNALRVKVPDIGGHLKSEFAEASSSLF